MAHAHRAEPDDEDALGLAGLGCCRLAQNGDTAVDRAVANGYLAKPHGRLRHVEWRADRVTIDAASLSCRPTGDASRMRVLSSIPKAALSNDKESGLPFELARGIALWDAAREIDARHSIEAMRRISPQARSAFRQARRRKSRIGFRLIGAGRRRDHQGERAAATTPVSSRRCARPGLAARTSANRAKRGGAAKKRRPIKKAKPAVGKRGREPSRGIRRQAAPSATRARDRCESARCASAPP